MRCNVCPLESGNQQSWNTLSVRPKPSGGGLFGYRSKETGLQCVTVGSERINTCAINFKYLKKQNSSFTFVSSGKVIFIFSFIITFEKYLYKIHGAGHVVLHKITSYVTCIKTGYVSELDLKLFLLTSLLSHVGV